MKAFKRADLILVAVLMIIGIGFYVGMKIGQSSGTFVSVRVDGVETARYPLSEDGIYRIESGNGDYNILSIEDGSASVTQSNCRNQICVHTGKKSQPGEIIVCLPHKVVFVFETED